MRNPNWRKDAACRSQDTEVFFPDQKRIKPVAVALLCGRCPVRVECLEHALALPEPFGIWGGVTPGTRIALRRGRYRRTCPACSSKEVETRGQHQICARCGLSWHVAMRSITTQVV